MQAPDSQGTCAGSSKRQGSVLRCHDLGWTAPGTRAPIQGHGPVGRPPADGCTDPSGLSSRGPARHRLACANAASFEIPRSRSSVSGLSSTTASVFAISTPRLVASPNPRLESSRVNRALPCHACAARSGSSREWLSTTISSTSESRLAFIEPARRARWSAHSHVTTTTVRSQALKGALRASAPCAERERRRTRKRPETQRRGRSNPRSCRRPRKRWGRTDPPPTCASARKAGRVD